MSPVTKMVLVRRSDQSIANLIKLQNSNSEFDRFEDKTDT